MDDSWETSSSKRRRLSDNPEIMSASTGGFGLKSVPFGQDRVPIFCECRRLRGQLFVPGGGLRLAVPHGCRQPVLEFAVARDASRPDALLQRLLQAAFPFLQLLVLPRPLALIFGRELGPQSSDDGIRGRAWQPVPRPPLQPGDCRIVAHRGKDRPHQRLSVESRAASSPDRIASKAFSGSAPVADTRPLPSSRCSSSQVISSPSRGSFSPASERTTCAM